MPMIGQTRKRRTGVPYDKENVIEKEGWHNPEPERNRMGIAVGYRCRCTKTTEKGAYRDVITKDENGVKRYYLHQNLILKDTDSSYELKDGGYQTNTTKNRLNRYTPGWIRVIQRDYDWYVKINGVEYNFMSGMEVTKEGRVKV